MSTAAARPAGVERQALAGSAYEFARSMGMTVLEDPELTAGEVRSYRERDDAGRPGRLVVAIGTRPETELAFAGRWVRWHVRRGYARHGILAWIGEAGLDGPEPVRGDLEQRVERMTGWTLGGDD
ncbi:hypothetical protein ACOACO_17565 [Nocardioides sp. CPCC 205120]|uniref:hypothetical protein n=1 Tax=Nocardioides sp. CPCC 205120 TaxID=3406462 RepID=UPI003B51006B